MQANGKSKSIKKVVSLVSNYDESDQEMSASEEENEEEIVTSEGEQPGSILSAHGSQRNESPSTRASFELGADESQGFSASLAAKHDDGQQIAEELGLASSSATESSVFTPQNGFLPGCENIKLPAPPKDRCSDKLQEKIVLVLGKMSKTNYNINDDIQNKKQFKNPSIYEKFIEHYDIDEFGSSFPDYIQDLSANGYLYYDELDARQREEWSKKEKEKKQGSTKVEVLTGTKRPKL